MIETDLNEKLHNDSFTIQGGRHEKHKIFLRDVVFELSIDNANHIMWWGGGG